MSSRDMRMTLDLGSIGEVEVEVDYDYTKGDKGCHTMRNGDPGWPATGPEISVWRVTTVHGLDITKLFRGEYPDTMLEAIEEHESDDSRCEDDDYQDECVREWVTGAGAI